MCSSQTDDWPGATGFPHSHSGPAASLDGFDQSPTTTGFLATGLSGGGCDGFSGGIRFSPFFRLVLRAFTLGIFLFAFSQVMRSIKLLTRLKWVTTTAHRVFIRRGLRGWTR